jgi:hypothetical protein
MIILVNVVGICVYKNIQEKERKKSPRKGISGGRLMDIDIGRGCTEQFESQEWGECN